MKKLTQEQFDTLEFRVKPSNLIVQELNKIGVGEHLLVEQKDWMKRSSISSMIHNSRHNGKLVGYFKTRVLANGGWVITRTA